jgi:protease II
MAKREEWGNPNEEKFFDYILGYSPTNNVQKGVKYPACLLTGGLNDPRVAYWEVSAHGSGISLYAQWRITCLS